ncbi:MAG: ABC transporter permease [Armatimonadetes bacterium]|nr:ABC transporter permease [Armatimonadota bacterium]
MSLNTFEFLASQASSAIRRNPLVTMAAITNVAVALAILGSFALVAINLHHMAALEAQSAVITCELDEGADPADVEAALLLDMRVKDTKFVTREEALENLAKKWNFDLDMLKAMGNPLPDTILVYVSDPEEIGAVAEAAGKVEGIGKAWYPEQITEKILTVARGVKISGLVVGAILILATLTVISTTIRLTIYARRREIRIMQLVGATRWFIRLPFLLEGLFQGVMGGLVAAIGVMTGYIYLEAYAEQNLQFVSLYTTTDFLVLFGAGVVLTGAVFGAVGSLAGIRQYLRTV